RLGVNLPWKTIEEFEDYRVKGMGITYRDLASKGKISFPAEYRKYEKQGLATPSGKIELYSSILAKVGQDPLPAHEEPPLSPESTHELWAQYPLITAHYRTAEYQHSEGRQLASLRKRIPDPLCEIHPETAKRLSIGPGDWLYLETPGFSKRIRLKARFCAQLDPRVIGVPVQWWYPEEKDSFHGCFNSNINSIISGEPPYDPISGQYQVRANLCRVVKS
ncbi:MAG: molybdopterin dinucleotide binding domain-containing protein, partial [Dehalococcoidia bacterium]|nr:molybdopterin dinucleotide binding domain-containing protein [Dehalococcoidia bacterium]